MRPNRSKVQLIMCIKSQQYAVGSNVAKALGCVRANEAVTKHFKGTLKQSILTNGGTQEINVIPQGDIIRLAVKRTLEGAEDTI